jgi:two-component system NtrC family sensor kinase
MEKIKILFVDDEQNVLNALKRLFADDDYTILTSTTGFEGLDIIQEESPQIIVSDYRMPGINGIDFLRKAYIRNPDAIRIILSGYADTAVVIEAINEGQIYKLIPKPWNDDELKIAISNAVDRYLLYKRNLELTHELKDKNEELTRLNKELRQLVKEKSTLLEFKGRVLINFQNIINAIPVGVMGVDYDGVMVQVNELWLNITGIDLNNLGSEIDSFLPEQLVDFIEIIKDTGTAEKYVSINKNIGKLLGSVINDATGHQKGVILTFIPTDEQKRV